MALDSKGIQTAIEMEEKGYNYYDEKAKEAVNKVSRRALESLASQELDHKKTFEKLAEGEKDFSGDLKAEEIENVIKEVFAEMSDKEKEDWKEKEVEVYEKALEFEKKTYRLYKDLKEQTDNEQEKEILEKIMQEESSHEDSLQNILYYLTDNTWWMADEESKTWNWMNI